MHIKNILYLPSFNLYTRPILIYNNDYFFIELPHLFLTSVSKPIENKTLEKISNCINDVYLIPKDERPFNLENNKEYFSKDFIKTFNSSFKKKKKFTFPSIKKKVIIFLILGNASVNFMQI